MRTLAIDLGTRRVGLAISDDAGQRAWPLEVLTINSPSQALAHVARLVQQEGVRRIVIGLPLNMDDSAGPAARQAIAWGGELAAACGLKPVFVDERLSSFAAEQQLAARRQAGEKLSRARKKRQLDAVAAAGFLQEFLDGKVPPLDVGE